MVRTNQCDPEKNEALLGLMVVGCVLLGTSTSDSARFNINLKPHTLQVAFRSEVLPRCLYVYSARGRQNLQLCSKALFRPQEGQRPGVRLEMTFLIDC